MTEEEIKDDVAPDMGTEEKEVAEPTDGDMAEDGAKEEAGEENA